MMEWPGLLLERAWTADDGRDAGKGACGKHALGCTSVAHGTDSISIPILMGAHG